MISVKLLDGSLLSCEKNTKVSDVVAKISISLAKSALAAKVNGTLVDLSYTLSSDCSLEVITAKNIEYANQMLRHDCAHLLAQALLELYPNIELSVGPATEKGFYYDFMLDEPLKESDLSAIENAMKHFVAKDFKIERKELSRNDAVSFFKKLNQSIKVNIISNIPESETLSIYTQGDFTDLCRGPHFPSTKYVGKHFKLTALSGINAQDLPEGKVMQRISGIVFFTKKELEDYLIFLEEVEKRDHRKLGANLKLFHQQQEAAGSVFWHNKGYRMYKNIENYILKLLETEGYNQVKTPQVMSRKFWELSGHWAKFKDNMFVIDSDKEETLAIKPMNCPGHVQIYNKEIRSYKDLPLRLAEFGSCHRNEPSGALHGLLRVREFTQDDGHIFCTQDQIVEETKSFCKALEKTYRDILGDVQIIVKFSDRPEVRQGSDEIWDKAEQSLRDAAFKAGLDLIENKGEGAFYGPKLEFTFKDSLGRHWQLGTLQVDFVLPKNLGATYINSEGERETPVMLHRAILGSFERFIGIMLEHHAGKLPDWITPIPLVIATVSDSSSAYATSLHRELAKQGVYSVLDNRNEKISYKIREHSVQKIPYIAILGDKDASNKTVSVRYFGENNTEVMQYDDFIEFIKSKVVIPG